MLEQGFPATLFLNFAPKPDLSTLLIPLYCLVTRNVSRTHSQEFQSNKQPMEENLAPASLATKEPGRRVVPSAPNQTSCSPPVSAGRSEPSPPLSRHSLWEWQCWSKRPWWY